MARGSIATRTNADGAIVHLIRYRGSDGRQVKKTVGTSRREAERALNDALAKVQRGELHAPSRETFDGYARRWLDDHRSRVEPSTACLL